MTGPPGEISTLVFWKMSSLVAVLEYVLIINKDLINGADTRVHESPSTHTAHKWRVFSCKFALFAAQGYTFHMCYVRPSVNHFHRKITLCLPSLDQAHEVLVIAQFLLEADQRW